MPIITRISIYLLLTVGLLSEVQAQDPQFSMFYSVPLYINPAMAGGRHANRAIVHHRWQWPNQDARFTTTQFSFDTYAAKYNSGFGVMAIQDYAGGNKITSTYLSVAYAYELAISKRQTLRFGLQGGLIQKALGDLSIPSQFDNNGQNNPGGGISNRILMPDIGAGVLFYDRNLYAGVNMSHLNRPNESFLNINNPLPVKLSVVGGYKIPIPLTGGGLKGRGLHGAPDYMYLTPTFTYKHQSGDRNAYIGQGADQVDLGLYLTRQWFIAGLWYRGIPFKGYKTDRETIYNNESIVFLLGASYNGLGFGYAFDLTISKQTLSRTGGAHEINLTYVFRTKRKKQVRALPCPDFEYDVLQRAGAGSGK